MIPVNVIVNADDFGYNHSRNDAIAKSFELGLINSTSIMSNMPGFIEAIDLANSNNFEDRIGLHVSLTEGASVTNLSGTSLVDSQGNFIKSKIYSPFVFVKPKVRHLVRCEIESQLNLVTEKGIVLTHINSHHTIHELPWLLPIFWKVAKKHNLKIRVSQTWQNQFNPVASIYRQLVNFLYKVNGRGFTSFFEVLEVYALNRSKRKDNSKRIEVMVHPGIIDGKQIIDSFDQVNLNEEIERIVFEPV